MEVLAKLERLAAAGIDIIPAPEIETHFILTRDGYAALVERRGDAFGRIGSSGLLCDAGLALLVWRGDEAFFVARGYEQRATDDQVLSLRRFAADLESALI